MGGGGPRTQLGTKRQRCTGLFQRCLQPASKHHIANCLMPFLIAFPDWGQRLLDKSADGVAGQAEERRWARKDQSGLVVCLEPAECNRRGQHASQHSGQDAFDGTGSLACRRCTHRIHQGRRSISAAACMELLGQAAGHMPPLPPFMSCLNTSVASLGSALPFVCFMRAPTKLIIFLAFPLQYSETSLHSGHRQTRTESGHTPDIVLGTRASRHFVSLGRVQSLPLAHGSPGGKLTRTDP